MSQFKKHIAKALLFIMVSSGCSSMQAVDWNGWAGCVWRPKVLVPLAVTGVGILLAYKTYQKAKTIGEETAREMLKGANDVLQASNQYCSENVNKVNNGQLEADDFFGKIQEFDGDFVQAACLLGLGQQLARAFTNVDDEIDPIDKELRNRATLVNDFANNLQKSDNRCLEFQEPDGKDNKLGLLKITAKEVLNA